MYILKLHVYLFTFLILNIGTAKSEVLEVAAIDWCPQICPTKSDPGYIIDITNKIFEGSKYQLNIEYLPWSRAINYVDLGKKHILLSPAKHEAPKLLYPNLEIGFQQMCFFTSKNNTWNYTGPDSLNDQQIGVAKDSYVGELEPLLLSLNKVFQFQPYHERFIKQNINKVLRNRIDSFLFTKNATNYELQKMGVENQFRIAGCLQRTPIYIALTPKTNQSFDMKTLIEFIDKRQLKLNSSGLTSVIKKHYAVD